MRISAPALFIALLPAAVTLSAQAPAAPAPSKYVSVIGTVNKADTAASVVAVKTTTGETTVKFDGKTAFLRIPAGETNMKKATPATAADVAPGDRVLARVHTEDPTGAPAITIYITKQTEIAQRQQKTLAEWQAQGVAGSVKAVDPAAKQVTISVRGGFGPPKDVTLDLSGAVDYERYNPDSAKYEPAALGPLQVGDQLRVLGQKNADQTQIKAEAVMYGTFKTVPVQIKSIDAATGQILATDLASKKPITILIRPETSMKKLDDATAAMMARRLNPSVQGGGRGQGGNSPGIGGGGAPGAGAPGGRGAGGGGGRAMDLGKMLEQQPAIQLSDLKPGEPVVITGSPVSDGSKLAATSLVAGVDPILRAAPQNGPDPLGGSWNLGDGGQPQ